MTRKKYKYQGPGYQTERKTKKKKPAVYGSEASKVFMLYNALKALSNWDSATPEAMQEFAVVEAHYRYWVDKFAKRNPQKPAQAINWNYYA